MSCEECKWWLGAGFGSAGICDNTSSVEFGKVIRDEDTCDKFERYYGARENDLAGKQRRTDKKRKS